MVAWDELDRTTYTLKTGEVTIKDHASGASQTARAPSVVLILGHSKASIIPSTDFETVDVDQSAAEQLRSKYVQYEQRLEELTHRFITANPTSEANAKRATSALPGGNTRTVLHSSPFPLIIKSGKGCHVQSAEGVEYIDLISEYSACMFGHSHPAIMDAIQRAASIGINLSGVTEHEVQFAELIKKRFPSMELMRFCNSGTEANTMALAAALYYTNKKRVFPTAMKFSYDTAHMDLDLGILWRLPRRHIGFCKGARPRPSSARLHHRHVQ